MSCLIDQERIVGPIKILPSGTLARGDVIAGHKHNFDHATILGRGRVRVRETHPDGSTVEHEHSELFDAWETRADVEHEITALEDGTVIGCVYPHREPDGTIVERYKGYEGAYR